MSRWSSIPVTSIAVAVLVLAAAAIVSTASTQHRAYADDSVTIGGECALPITPDAISGRNFVVFPFRVPSVHDDRREWTSQIVSDDPGHVPYRVPFAVTAPFAPALLRAPTQSVLCCFLS